MSLNKLGMVNKLRGLYPFRDDLARDESIC